MKIRCLDSTELEIYDDIARQHGTLFNCLDWLALYGDNVQILGIFEDGGELVGGISFFKERRFGLKIVRNPPFTPMCGPFMAIKAKNPVAILEKRRKVLECVVEYLEKESPAIISVGLDQGVYDALPFYWNDYKVIPVYTYLIDLSLSLLEIQNNMSSAQRNHILKARKDGLIVKRTYDMHIVRDLVLTTFDRQKKSLNKYALDNILFRYANNLNSYAFTTYRGNNPISTCFVLHNKTTAYNLLAGYKTQERHHGAGPLAVFEAIIFAKEIGVRTFDFEGSVIPAIETYFRGFGGKLTPYFTVNKAWLPFEIGLKFIKRKFF